MDPEPLEPMLPTPGADHITGREPELPGLRPSVPFILRKFGPGTLRVGEMELDYLEAEMIEPRFTSYAAGRATFGLPPEAYIRVAAEPPVISERTTTRGRRRRRRRKP